jgi:prepilin-type N-terminal cleavage/methylation domain-containing protein
MERRLLNCRHVRRNSRAHFDMHRISGARFGNEAGMTLLELLVVIGILGTLAAMAIMVSPAMTQHARADATIEQALDLFRSAREVAISQRRNVEVRFIGLTALQTWRLEVDPPGPTPAPAPTLLRTVELPNRAQVRLEDGIPYPPDQLFPGAPDAAHKLSLAGEWTFTSEGSLVGTNGDVANGVVFISIPNQPNSARALTVLGATALIRAWKWNGAEWVE